MADDARDRIIAAARELFAEHGFDSVGVRAVAERAGVTHGLLRHHFGSKDGVWRAVVQAADQTFGQSLMPVLRRASAGDADPVEDTAALVAALAETSARHPQFVQLLLAEGFSDGTRLGQIMAGLRPLQDSAAALLGRLHERGQLRQFDAGSFTAFLLLTVAAPFALTALVQGLRGGTDAAPLEPAAHARQVVHTLFGAARQ